MWYIHKINKQRQPLWWQGTGPCQPGVYVPCCVLDCSHALPFSELWGQRGCIPLPKYRYQVSHSWCSKGMSKTSSSALPCGAKVTSRITISVHCCVSEWIRRRGKEGADLWHIFPALWDISEPHVRESSLNFFIPTYLLTLFLSIFHSSFPRNYFYLWTSSVELSFSSNGELDNLLSISGTINSSTHKFCNHISIFFP